MPLELKIRWQGAAPGLTEKRLSLGAFADPLAKLLASLRRIASNIIGQAFDDRRPTGRFANAARQLDIEITDLLKDSSGFDSVITVTTPFGGTLPLLDLGESAGKLLLEALDAESRGVATDAIVRSYLRSLPNGIARQDYSLHRNGTVLRHISFGEATLPQLPPDVPYIAHFVGHIVGVGFEPGRSEVRVKADSSTLTFTAESRLVEAALHLRHIKIQAVAVTTAGTYRLLILQPADTPIATSTRAEAVYDRWQAVLKRLAQ
jgi:hypothetical protein